MRIGKAYFSSKVPLALAPMAGYSNVALREISARMGADIVYTELASAAALANRYDGKPSGIETTKNLIKTAKSGVSGIQIFGSSREDITGAVKYIERYTQTGECEAKFIDLNMGCPAGKVKAVGAGCELLKDIPKLEGLVDAAVRASKNIPITVKMRILPSIDDTLMVAKMFERKGVAALTIHGRTPKQKFGGNANWGIIGQVKKIVNIPVIGNGDVANGHDAKRLLRISNCDAIMIGRAALENPFVFYQIKDTLVPKQSRKIHPEDKVKYIGQYFDLCIDYGVDFVEAKERALQMVVDVRAASLMRDRMVRSNDWEELYSLFVDAVSNPKTD